MIYLTLDDALFIHREQLRLFGGAPGIRDLGLVEAALLERVRRRWNHRSR